MFHADGGDVGLEGSRVKFPGAPLDRALQKLSFCIQMSRCSCPDLNRHSDNTQQAPSTRPAETPADWEKNHIRMSGAPLNKAGKERHAFFKNENRKKMPASNWQHPNLPDPVTNDRPSRTMYAHCRPVLWFLSLWKHDPDLTSHTNAVLSSPIVTAVEQSGDISTDITFPWW